MQASLRSGKSRSRGQKRKPEHGAEDEHVIRGAAGIHVVGVDLQLCTVVHQTIEHIGRLVVGRRHHLDVVGAVLIRDMSVEADAGVYAVPCVFR